MSDRLTGNYPFADIALARRLELAEASFNRAMVETRARWQPESPASWIEVGGAYAMFDGVGSPITQTFGLGLTQPIGPVEMEALESFFEGRGATVTHEISPLADSSLWSLLDDRGYRPAEFSTVLVRPTVVALAGPTSTSEPIRVRRIDPGEEQLWARVSAEGWQEFPASTDLLMDLGELIARSVNTVCFLAELDGVPVASAALGLFQTVAVLAGASTIASARNRGAQHALLHARLQAAVAHDCDLAMMTAQPGSTSQRNSERQGFRIAYTRTKWTRRSGARAAP